MRRERILDAILATALDVALVVVKRINEITARYVK